MSKIPRRQHQIDSSTYEEESLRAPRRSSRENHDPQRIIDGVADNISVNRPSQYHLKENSSAAKRGPPSAADDDTVDEATATLVSKLVATELAKQDHKDKLTAASAGAVMKRRPPPSPRKQVAAVVGVSSPKKEDQHQAAAAKSKREHGPTTSPTARSPGKSTVTTTTTTTTTASTLASSSKHEDMIAAKRRERESGAAAATSVARTPLNRAAAAAGNNNVDAIMEAKRRERSAGVGATAVVARAPFMNRRSHVGGGLQEGGSNRSAPRPLNLSPTTNRNSTTTTTLDSLSSHSRDRKPSSTARSKTTGLDSSSSHSQNRKHYSSTTIMQSKKESPVPNIKDDTTMMEAKQRERERGPSMAAAVARAPLNRRALLQETERAGLDSSSSHSRGTKSPSSPKDAMVAAKNRERESGPAMASAVARAPLHRKSHQHDRKPAPHSYQDSSKSRSPKQRGDNDYDDDMEIKRRERERGPTTAAAMALRPPARFSSSTDRANGSALPKASGDAMAEAKRRERESGPTTAEATVVPRSPVRSSQADISARDEKRRARASRNAVAVARSPVARASLGASSLSEQNPRGASAVARAPEQNHSLSPKKDNMAEAKRLERERGPATASAVVSRSARSSHRHQREQQETTVATTRDDMAEAKRREKERGPSVTAAVPGRNTASRPPSSSSPPGRKPTSDREMAEIKRRERESGPALAVAVSSNYSTTAQASMGRNQSKTTENNSRDDDAGSTCSDDSAYALAMARSSMSREAAKLREQESGPSLASATSGEVNPGAFTIVGRELREKEQDNGPSLAPALGQVEPSSPHSVALADDNDEEEEAQQAVGAAFPGAFAVQGVRTNDTDSDYSSSEEDPETTHSSDRAEEVGVTVTPERPAVSQALQAEVIEEQVIIEGAVVTAEDDEEVMDPKALRRVRLIQGCVLCFAVGSITLIIAIVLSLSGGEVDNRPTVEGWIQAGPDLFGPTEEPQTLFGSAVALGSNGTRLAVTAPGVQNGTFLNVGETYVMEQIRTENGTDWEVLDTVAGLGQSNEAHMSLAMSLDSTRFAVGYPRLVDGSKVQVYDEQPNGSWEAESLPIEGPEGVIGDEAWFGYAVDLSADGNILAIGAPVLNGPFGTQSGAVQVYQKSSTTGAWEQLGSDIVGSAASEFFGWSVALSSDGLRIAVGAPVSDDSTGVVRVFNWDGTLWTRFGGDLIGSVPLNRFGESVSLSADGSVLAVGARGTAFENGQVHILREVNGDWEFDSSPILGKETGEAFGSAVSLSADGNTLAIGGPQNSLYGDGAGRIQVLNYDSGSASWIPNGSDIGSESVAELGAAVALSLDGKRVVGGAPTTSYVGSITRAGSVQVWDEEVEEEK